MKQEVKRVAAAVNKLGKYAVKYYDVSRRIVRMNKRLHMETGECLFEKRGHKWALTKFAFDVYGVTFSDLEKNQESQTFANSTHSQSSYA